MPNKVATQRGYTPGRRREDYRGLFSSDRGKRVLNDLANAHFLYAPAADATQEGERRVVLRILQVMAMDVSDPQERVSEFMQQFMEQVDGSP